MKNIIIIFTLLFSHLINAQTTIGWGISCDYDMNTDSNALQQAIDDGMTNLRLTNENVFLANIVIGENISIKGGYNNCADALSDTQSVSNSVIDGSAALFPVIRMNFVDEANTIFDHLTIINGTGLDNGNPVNSPGGIGFRDVRGEVLITHSNISSNTGIYGGAINTYNFGGASQPAALDLTISDTIIENNSSSATGGGLECHRSDQPITITLNQGSTIRNNHASGNGGGVFNGNCNINFYAGTSQQTTINPGYELYHNTTDKSGGGLASQAGTINFIGSATEPFDIIENQSGLDTNSGQGGGISITGLENDSIVNLTNTYVTANKTNRYGAGLFVSFSGIININSSNCNYNTYCSKISDNILLDGNLGGGAAIAARFNAKLNVYNTLITRNNSNNSNFISYTSSGAEMLLEGNLIIDNGDDNSYSNNIGFYSFNDMATTTLAYNTIQGNNINNFNVLFKLGSDSNMNLFGNIINEVNQIYQAHTSATSTIACNMINDDSTIAAPMTDTIIGTPIYIDDTNGDFRLDSTSTQSMDLCSKTIYHPSKDLSGRVRGVDNINVVDLNGFYDLGAYEFDDGDLIFIDSFE